MLPITNSELMGHNIRLLSLLGGNMPKRVVIEPHLSTGDLENRYQQSQNSIERSHYQIIWLLAMGKTTLEVSTVTGYGVSWIYELVRSYNRYGPEILGDLRRNNRGTKPLLNDEQLQYLQQVLQSEPEDGGPWNGAKVSQWMSKILNRTVYPQRGWEYLKKLQNG
jgi:transposase